MGLEGVDLLRSEKRQVEGSKCLSPFLFARSPQVDGQRGKGEKTYPAQTVKQPRRLRNRRTLLPTSNLPQTCCETSRWTIECCRGGGEMFRREGVDGECLGEEELGLDI